MEMLQILGSKQVQCSNRNCLNSSAWILLPSSSWLNHFILQSSSTLLLSFITDSYLTTPFLDSYKRIITLLHAWAANKYFDSNLGMLLTFKVDWQCLSKEYCLSLSHLRLLPLPETWNQKRHSVQTVQTWLHPGRKNLGGPVSLNHPPGTSSSGCAQLSGQLALPVGTQ